MPVKDIYKRTLPDTVFTFHGGKYRIFVQDMTFTPSMYCRETTNTAKIATNGQPCVLRTVFTPLYLMRISSVRAH